MSLYAELFRLLDGSVPRVRLFRGKLAYGKKTAALRALGKGRFRPRTRKYARQVQVVCINNVRRL